MGLNQQQFLQLFGKSVDTGANVASDTLKTQAENDAKLTQLIKGKQLDDEIAAAAQARNLKLAQEHIDKNAAQGKKVNIGLGQGGAVSIGEAESNPFANLASYLNLKDRQDARLEKQVREISDRVAKEKLPEVAQALKGAEGSFKGKSVGPLMNILPEGLQGVVANVRSRVGEALNMPEWKGSGEEWQELQRLRNIDIRSFSGSAQTMAETARQMIEKGVQAGGSPEQVRRGMQMMRQAAELNAKNLEAGSTPEALRIYTQQQGGVSPTGLLGPTPAARPIKTLRNKKTGATKQVYADTGEDVK